MLVSSNENKEKKVLSGYITFSSPLKHLLVGLFLTSVLMVSSGVSLTTSLLLSLALIGQWIPGASLWRWLSRERRTTFPEILGMGLAIGTLLALLSSQLFRITPLGKFGWAIPFLISVPILTWQKLRGDDVGRYRTLGSSIRQSTKSFSPAIIFGIIQLSVWWRWHPLKWSGWWKYNVDVPYFESYSNSLALLGTTHSLIDSTLDSRYHWFAFAWIGSLTESLQIDSFVVLTRLLPIVAMTMGATIAYSWTQSISKSKWTPALAALIVVVGPGLSVGSFVMLRSPSSAMSVGWSLAFSFLLFEIINGKVKRPIAYLVLAILSCGVVGGKASNAVLVGVAIMAILITSFSQISETRKRIWVSGVISLIVVGLTFKLLISTSETRPLGIGLFFGWPGLFLTIIPISIGICGLWQQRKSSLDPLLVYTTSMILIGSLLSLFTHEPYGNQIYFLVSAATICIVPSLVGFEEFLYREKKADLLALVKKSGRQPKLYLGIVVILAGVTTSTVWILFENSTSSFGKLGRTIAPFPLWTLCALASLVLAQVLLPQVKVYEKQVDLLLVTLISASLISSGSGILYSIFKGPLYSESSGILGYGKSTKSDHDSISYNYVLAGKWVQEHTQSEEIFFTNRQCVEANTTLTDCDGLWSYASALSKRKFVTEGDGYSIKSTPMASIRSEDEKRSIRFSLNPNEEDWQNLWAKNVRWGWIDRKVSSRTDWGKFAQEVFSNSDVAVIKLLKPD